MVKVVATDEDSGANGHVTYSIDPKGRQAGEVLKTFRLDASTGVVRLASALNREVVASYRFRVLASNPNSTEQKNEQAKKHANGRNNVKSASTQVVIHVTDVDDNGPVFVQSHFRFRVFENQPPQTVVGKVRAVDADTETHNRFRYRLQDTNFLINSSTGLVSGRKAFDREVKEFHHFDVVVLSQTGNGKNDTCRVTVQIMDQNDNAPVFTFPSSSSSSSSSAGVHTLHIQLDHPLGAEVTSLSASDADVGKNADVSYHVIEEGNASKYFRLDSRTGSLQLGLLSFFLFFFILKKNFFFFFSSFFFSFFFFLFLLFYPSFSCFYFFFVHPFYSTSPILLNISSLFFSLFSSLFFFFFFLFFLFFFSFFSFFSTFFS